MADQPQKPGFQLPSPGGATDAGPSQAPASPRESQPVATTAVPLTLDPDTSARDLAIGAGLLLVLVIAFVFARNAYANALVGRKIAPRSANGAGWYFFILLTSLATAAVLGFVDHARFFTLAFVVPLGLVAIAAAALMLVTSRR